MLRKILRVCRRIGSTLYLTFCSPKSHRMFTLKLECANIQSWFESIHKPTVATNNNANMCYYVCYTSLHINPFSTGTGWTPVQSLWRFQNLVWNGLIALQVFFSVTVVLFQGIFNIFLNKLNSRSLIKTLVLSSVSTI